MAQKRHRLIRILFLPVIILHFVFTILLGVVCALVVGLWEVIQEEWLGKKSQTPAEDPVSEYARFFPSRAVWVSASLLTVAACVLLGSELAIQLTRLALRADDVRIRLVAMDCARWAAKWPARIGDSADVFYDLVRLTVADPDARIRANALGILTSDFDTHPTFGLSFHDYLFDPNAAVQARAIDMVIRFASEEDNLGQELFTMAHRFTRDGEDDAPAAAAGHLACRLSQDYIWAMLTDNSKCMYRCGLSMISANCTGEVASAALRAIDFYRRPAEEREWLNGKLALPIRSWRHEGELFIGEVDARFTAIRERLMIAETQEAKDAVEQLCWTDAERANTMSAYRTYIETYPSGRYAQSARTRQAALADDEAPFIAASQAGTEEALERFLHEYPGHVREAEARQLLHSLEGYDIVDLLDKGMIEVEPVGSGIERVAVKVRRLVPYGVTVKVPVGTFFVAQDSSAQNMVTTAECRETLTTDDWATIHASCACASHSRAIPGQRNRFAVQRSSHSVELVRLMPALDKADVSYPVCQAAVWIVTDDVSYRDLGRLVSRFSFMPTGGVQIIKQYEAAQAMKICDETGIDITQKAIWQDRATILEGLEDAGLKTWLEARQAGR